jgi:hypothetical protein
MEVGEFYDPLPPSAALPSKGLKGPQRGRVNLSRRFVVNAACGQLLAEGKTVHITVGKDGKPVRSPHGITR